MKFTKLFVIITLLVVSKHGFSQVPKPIYFLADTLGTDPKSRIFETGSEGAWQYYNFYCRCIKNYDRDIVFVYEQKFASKSVQSDKPIRPYLSWKELSRLLWEEGRNFDKKYSLHIIEVLPNNQFVMNRVMLFLAETKY